ncbi:hypothetical protein ASC95_22560 [Pelomonas sp. Root1217]|nr:hypothetical protein ASC95_22560 [Pelomonas sp. Root1217]
MATGRSRTGQENLQVTTAFGRQLTGFAGIVLVVSNPVDAGDDRGWVGNAPLVRQRTERRWGFGNA